MEANNEKAIGGYPSLELPFSKMGRNQATAQTNSARSAIKIILKSVNAKKIWLPAYTCDAVVNAINSLDIAFEYYEISPTFDVNTIIHLRRDEYILIVDYFGISSASVMRNLNRFGHKNTIVDCSQAYFSKHAGALATIWSPRKFFGLPDGGLLYSDDTRIKQPTTRDDTSQTRMSHLISRLTDSPEKGYHKYLEAEQTIAKSPIMGMSKLTERLLNSIDYEPAKLARADNAEYLHKLLGKYNQLNLSFDPTIAPLCYPLLPNVNTIDRSELIKNRVFSPCYWPEVLTRVKEGSFEWDLVTKGLFLPCDQRYTKHDMDRIFQLLITK
jgi:hypothetical protein